MSATDDRQEAAHGDPTGPDEERTPGLRRHEVDVVEIPYRPVWSTFALLLHGPVLWSMHFLGVYLAAEWACMRGGGPDAATTATVWGTIAFAVAIAVGTTVTAARWREGTAASDRFAEDETRTADVEPAVRDRVVLGIGLVLGPLFLLAVLAVGVTALVVPPC